MRKTESSSKHSRLKIALIPFALLAYPVFIHTSLALQKPLLIAGIWLIISVIGLAVSLRGGPNSLTLMFGSLLAAGLVLWLLGSTVDLMFVPPVLINIALMMIFGRTLAPGATPLVGRVAALWRGELDAEVASYTRRVTIAWTIFFAVVAIQSVALALFASLHVWSLFTNFLNYILILLFFIIEYQMRLRCLPNHEHLSFRAFCRLMLSTDLRTLAR